LTFGTTPFGYAIAKDHAAITATALLQILKTVSPQQWRSASEAYLRDEFADLARTALNEIRHEDE
jgi:hypothetical protein